jgi:hypothetical protein
VIVKHHEHTYYWAWKYEDNPDHSFLRGVPTWYRVFRFEAGVVHDAPITEPMTREEAVAYCQRIVKLTGGVEI